MPELSSGLRRLWPTLILAAVAVALGFDCVKGPMGVNDLIALHQHQTRLEAVRDQLAADNEMLDQRVRRLKSDDHEIERLIRRELGYARPDELIYRFSDSGTSGPQR